MTKLPATFATMKPALQRAVMSRVLGTEDSRTLDAAVQTARVGSAAQAVRGLASASNRGTGQVIGPDGRRMTAIELGLFVTLAVGGGALLGAAGTLAVQKYDARDMDDVEYRRRLNAAVKDYVERGERRPIGA